MTSETLNSSEELCLDSGCTKHVTNDITDLDPTTIVKIDPPSRIHFGKKDMYVLATAKGTMTKHFDMHGMKISLHFPRTLLAPDMDRKLISIPMLTKDHTSTVIFNGKEAYIKKGDKLVAIAHIDKENLYILKQWKEDHSGPPSTTSMDITHQKLGHISKEAILSMKNSGKVTGLDYINPSDPLTPCNECLLGKMQRSPVNHKKVSSVADHIGARVHSDILGPMEQPSHCGYKYIISFTDDYSRYSTIYPMFRKSDAFDCYLKYSAMLRQHLNSPTLDPIKVLRTDGDGVYQQTQFQEHLKVNGTRHEFTSRARAEDNARSERFGRTIVEMARAMLANSRFQKQFWLEACNTATYCLNS
jgi:hypothetical protein